MSKNKLKDLVMESTWGKRKFGEKLPTISDYVKAREDRIKKEGFGDDLKTFKTEYDSVNNDLKLKANTLKEKKQIMKAVGMVTENLKDFTSELAKLPVVEVLDNVNKTNSKKYQKAIETLESICEVNNVWLKENK